MTQVAELAGVGLKTVSRVVNGEPGVSTILQERVRAAVKALNYEADIYAGSLRRSSRRTFTVGLLVKDLANPFSGAIARAVERSAAADRVAVLAASVDNDENRVDEIARAFMQRRVDGLIVAPADDGERVARAAHAQGIPIVMIDRTPPRAPVDSVVSDNRLGAELATEQLLNHGHTRIAFLGEREGVFTESERLAGFTRALAKAGVPLDQAIIVQGVTSASDASAQLANLLTTHRPTAVFSAQNVISKGVIAELRRHGLADGIAMVGFDDLEYATLLTPGITTVAQDPDLIGSTAAAILLRRIEGDNGAPERVVVPTRLIARGSGEITAPGWRPRERP
ncbi:LacI family DNA-binding transcriptional regulator [Leifsonia sp. TF02-11]|uniref:LacI family DNA-binding transcriptional regulator n=1 Tax=Leifsonia sp. TF02-11 TaxID=2815212 RepID=UPI001FB731D4|nr:LacI family DNA-binding transcriptional regulator [Leifsonia sp. TF02-11]